MTWLVIILELLAVSLAATVFILIQRFLDKRSEQNRLEADHVQEQNKKRLDKALKELNTKATWEKDHEDLIAHFDYQSGHFRIRLEKNSVKARLFFFYFFDTPISYLELVRSLCNQCNLNAESCRIVYTVNNKTGKVDVHILDTMTLHDDDATTSLQRELNSIFYWQTLFIQRYSELKPATKHSNNHDLEKQNAEWQHELFLIREQEMMHQSEGPHWHENKDKEFHLDHLLATTLGLSSIKPVDMEICRNNTLTHLEEADKILSYPIHQALFQDNDTILPFAVLRLNYVDPCNPTTPQHLVIDMEQEGRSADTIYYRATLCVIPSPLDPNTPVSDSSDHQKRMTSILLGYDIHGKSNLQEKFNYIWKEAMAKQKEGSTDQLTEDERLLLRLQTPQTRQLFLESKDLIHEKRYYEAIQRLKPVFQEMAEKYPAMDPENTHNFYEVCYLLGSCYTCLGQYKEGLYYLQPTISTRRITYTEMYVNCLVNSHDFRALGFVNELLQDLVPPIENEIEDEENYQEEMHANNAFINFLKRRKAYMLVERKCYDDAEKILKEMLDEPDSSDFALQELAFIQKNKGK